MKVIFATSCLQGWRRDVRQFISNSVNPRRSASWWGVSPCRLGISSLAPAWVRMDTTSGRRRKFKQPVDTRQSRIPTPGTTTAARPFLGGARWQRADAGHAAGERRRRESAGPGRVDGASLRRPRSPNRRRGGHHPSDPGGCGRPADDRARRWHPVDHHFRRRRSGGHQPGSDGRTHLLQRYRDGGRTILRGMAAATPTGATGERITLTPWGAPLTTALLEGTGDLTARTARHNWVTREASDEVLAASTDRDALDAYTRFETVTPNYNPNGALTSFGPSQQVQLQPVRRVGERHARRDHSHLRIRRLRPTGGRVWRSARRRPLRLQRRCCPRLEGLDCPAAPAGVLALRSTPPEAG